MRGTWQGSGTWQTTGSSGPGPLAAMAVAAIMVIGALEWLLARIWWLIRGTVALVAVIVAAYVALSRWTERREARFAERRRAELATRAAAELPHRPRPAAAQAAQQPPAIHYHVHYHVHVGDREATAIIRDALPGTAGDAIAEGKPQL